jgi:hypothetical protein
MNLFSIDKKPVKGLLPMEWVILAYTVLTLVLMLLMYTRLHNPASMLQLRFQAVAIMLATWGVYRLVPCRLVMLLRVCCQMGLLGVWYPDTYEFNRLLPNLDHVFAQAEQSLFGFQPALTFSQSWSHPVVSSGAIGWRLSLPVVDPRNGVPARLSAHACWSA